MVLEHDRGPEWHLTHDPAGGFAGMSWRTTTEQADFAEKHEWLSTAPESGFVQVAMAERRDATGVDVIRGLVRARIGVAWKPRTAHGVGRIGLTCSPRDFGLRFDASPPDTRDRLWDTVLAAHRRWETANNV